MTFWTFLLFYVMELSHYKLKLTEVMSTHQFERGQRRGAWTGGLGERKGEGTWCDCIIVSKNYKEKML